MYKTVQRVYDTSADWADKSFLAALAHWAPTAVGDHIRPGMKRLCQQTSLSRSTVQRNLRRLIRLGWLTRTRSGRNGKTSEYRIEWKNIPTVGCQHSDALQGGTRDALSGSRVDALSGSRVDPPKKERNKRKGFSGKDGLAETGKRIADSLDDSDREKLLSDAKSHLSPFTRQLVETRPKFYMSELYVVIGRLAEEEKENVAIE